MAKFLSIPPKKAPPLEDPPQTNNEPKASRRARSSRDGIGNADGQKQPKKPRASKAKPEVATEPEVGENMKPRAASEPEVGKKKQDEPELGEKKPEDDNKKQDKPGVATEPGVATDPEVGEKKPDEQPRAEIAKPTTEVHDQGLGVNVAPPVCCKCRNEVDPLRCYGKSPGTWKCGVCNTRCVQLTRKFGSWPIAGFEGLSEEAKTEFWNDLKSCQGMGDIEKLVESSITTVTTSHQATNFGGDWLPLSVWSQRGWDPEEIKKTANATNSKPHPRWGMVYKIVVEHDSLGTMRENKQTEVAAATQAKAKMTKKESSSSNSSTSSSSSSDDKKEEEERRQRRLPRSRKGQESWQGQRRRQGEGEREEG